MSENEQNSGGQVKPFSNSDLGLESMPQTGGIEAMRRELGANEVTVGYVAPRKNPSGPLTPEMIGEALMASGAEIKPDKESIPLAQKIASEPGINDPDIKPLRTYKTDVEEAIKNQRLSVAKIASDESIKREEQPIENIEKSVYSIDSIGRFLPAAIISGILVAVGIGAIYFVFVRDTKIENLAPLPANMRKIPIEATKKRELPLTFTQSPLVDFANSIKNSTDLRVGDTLVFDPVIVSSTGKQKVDTSMFFDKATPRMPGILARSLDSVFAIGVNELEGSTPFIVIFTNSFDNAFSGMLAWEPSMPAELMPIIRLSGDVTPQDRVFYDKVVKNKDARVLRNVTGTDVLFYTFATRDTVVITTKQKTLEFLIEEITKTRAVQ